MKHWTEVGLVDGDGCQHGPDSDARITALLEFRATGTMHGMFFERPYVVPAGPEIEIDDYTPDEIDWTGFPE